MRKKRCPDEPDEHNFLAVVTGEDINLAAIGLHECRHS